MPENWAPVRTFFSVLAFPKSVTAVPRKQCFAMEAMLSRGRIAVPNRLYGVEASCFALVALLVSAIFG